MVDNKNDKDDWKKKHKFDESQAKYFWETYPVDANNTLKAYKEADEQLRNLGEIPKDYPFETEKNLRHVVAKILKEREEIRSRRAFDERFEEWIIK